MCFAVKLLLHRKPIFILHPLMRPLCHYRLFELERSHKARAVIATAMSGLKLLLGWTEVELERESESEGREKRKREEKEGERGRGGERERCSHECLIHVSDACADVLVTDDESGIMKLHPCLPLHLFPLRASACVFHSRFILKLTFRMQVLPVVRGSLLSIETALPLTLFLLISK